jgi:hypothetical protein
MDVLKLGAEVLQKYKSHPQFTDAVQRRKPSLEVIEIRHFRGLMRLLALKGRMHTLSAHMRDPLIYLYLYLYLYLIYISI